MHSLLAFWKQVELGKDWDFEDINTSSLATVSLADESESWVALNLFICCPIQGLGPISFGVFGGNEHMKDAPSIPWYLSASFWHGKVWDSLEISRSKFRFPDVEFQWNFKIIELKLQQIYMPMIFKFTNLVYICSFKLREGIPIMFYQYYSWGKLGPCHVPVVKQTLK